MNGSVDFNFVDHSHKPFKGYIRDWKFIDWYGKEIVVGEFVDHPEFAGKRGHTSQVVAKYDADDYWDVYTLNSHYKLNYDEKEPDREFWDMS